ncbi:MAG: MurT ligase domain-containing protein [Acutalibacteraceae bacterium]
MNRVRYFIALWVSKLVYCLLRLLKRNATMYPGFIALKICPDYLKQTKKSPNVLCVTGTNGKTTTTNMVADILSQSGMKVVSNRYGSNINTGVATALTHSVNIFGRPKIDALVLEVDERFSRLILPFIKPDYLIVTNLFRDSIKRNAHPEYIFSILDTYVPKTTKLILNADCLQSSQLLKDNDRVYFGIDKLDTDVTECINLINDFSICPKCDSKLEYDYLRYHHIGKAHCSNPDCDFRSYDADYLLTDIDYKNKTITIEHKGTKDTFPMVNRALYNIYNELAAITLMSEFNVDINKVKEYMAKISVTQTRYNETKAGRTEVIRTMAKGQNSVSCSRTLDFVGHETGSRTVFIMIDDLFERRDSSEFIGWIYDADFEFLNTPDIKQIVLAGPRCFDYKLRLLIAGVPADRILCEEDEFKAVDIMDKDIDKLYLLHDTSTYDLACKVEEKIKIEFSKAQSVKDGDKV